MGRGNGWTHKFNYVCLDSCIYAQYVLILYTVTEEKKISSQLSVQCHNLEQDFGRASEKVSYSPLSWKCFKLLVCTGLPTQRDELGEGRAESETSQRN